MTIFTGILLMLVIGLGYLCAINFIEFKKEPRKKIKFNFGTFGKTVVILFFLLIILLIFYIPFSGFISDSNKGYAGSLLGSFLAVLGAVSAALITVKLNKKHEERKEYPKKYAKLQGLIKNSRKYFISLETIFFNKEILDDPDKYMYKKLEEFVIFYNETSDDLTDVDFKESLKFNDLYRDEFDLASSLLNQYKKIDSIQMHGHIAAFYEMFQTSKAKEVLKTGRKIDEEDPDDTIFRIIDGKILSQIFIPTIETKLTIFIQELISLDQEMRSKF